MPGIMILISDIFAVILAIIAVIGALAVLILQWKNRRIKIIPSVVTALIIIATAASIIFIGAASYLFSIPLICLALAAICPRRLNIFAAAIFGFIVLLLYTPVCWLLGITLGTEALQLIIVGIAVPIIIIAALLAFCIGASKKSSKI